MASVAASVALGGCGNGNGGKKETTGKRNRSPSASTTSASSLSTAPTAPRVAPTPPPAGPDACRVLSASDISSVTGTSLEGADRGATVNTCTYRLAGRDEVLVSTYTRSAKEVFASTRGDPAPGAGDQAKWNADANTLTAIKGDKLVTVGLVLAAATPEQLLAQAKALANRALTQLAGG